MLSDFLICLFVAGGPALVVHLFHRASYKAALKRVNAAHLEEINRIRKVHAESLRATYLRTGFFAAHTLGDRTVR